MTKPLHLLLCLGLATGCRGDEPKKAAPVPSSSSAPTKARDDRGPAAFTDEDRGVIAYLDGWEPLQQELRAELVSVKKRATSTRMDLARHRDGADPEGACAAITALLERNAAWHREHALPAPLTTERVFDYESSLRSRHTGKGDDLKALSARVGAFHDDRDTFERKNTFELKQQLENLRCDTL